MTSGASSPQRLSFPKSTGPDLLVSLMIEPVEL